MCVLHVESKSTSFTVFLEKSELEAYRAHCKGDQRDFGKRLPYEDYGFSSIVSEKEWDDFEGQINDALAYLKKHYSDLKRLIQTHTIDDIRFDLPYWSRLESGVIVQCDFLPPEFLKLAGELGIGIELSLYPRAEENSEQSDARDESL